MHILYCNWLPRKKPRNKYELKIKAWLFSKKCNEVDSSGKRCSEIIIIMEA